MTGVYYSLANRKDLMGAELSNADDKGKKTAGSKFPVSPFEKSRQIKQMEKQVAAVLSPESSPTKEDIPSIENKKAESVKFVVVEEDRFETIRTKFEYHEKMKFTMFVKSIVPAKFPTYDSDTDLSDITSGYYSDETAEEQVIREREVMERYLKRVARQKFLHMKYNCLSNAPPPV